MPMSHTNIVEKLSMENNMISKQELEDLNDIRQQSTAVSNVLTHHFTII